MVHIGILADGGTRLEQGGSACHPVAAHGIDPPG